MYSLTSWFLWSVLLCLHSSVLCKNSVTSLYLAGVSLNFPIFFCIKSLMLDLTNYIQIQHTLSYLCLSFPPTRCPSAGTPDSQGLRSAHWTRFIASMTIDTFSGYQFGNALTREATKYETSHCLHVFLYWMFKRTWSYWPLQSDI